MRPTILTFNLADERLAKLRFLCMKLGCAVKPIPEDDWGQSLSTLCGASDMTETAPAAHFDGEMLVFCHMDNAAVNRFLQTAKQMRFQPVALKAVLTPTNAEWSPVRLHAELTAERTAILKGKTADHADGKEHPHA